MKKSILVFVIFFVNIFHCLSQEILTDPIQESNTTIQQISGDGLANVIGIQDLNLGLNNPSMILQVGNHNKLSVKQTSDALEGKNNQTLNFQIGNTNGLSLEQIGKGNLLLSFQMGYLALENLHKVYDLYRLNDIEHSGICMFSGDGNKMEISQQGNENGILAVQQGYDNFISAGQKGNNNFLLVLQKGNDNSVTGYRQENNSGSTLFDSIVQEGENLSVITDGFARINPGENLFTQAGTNLTIEVHNEFLNKTGDIEVSQTGRDMKIVVDQSYFSNPLK